MTIIDASLATKLLINERDSDDARRWLSGQNEAVAPDLLAIEVAQAVVRRVNAREDTTANGRSMLHAWRDILDSNGILLVRTGTQDMAEAAELAIAIGHPIKDCIYLALAIQRNADLMTCDARFAAKARPMYTGVRLLADDAK